MTIADAYLAACREELAAPKPGNVHVHGDGHGMTVDDFTRSADVSAPFLCAAGATLGRRILGAAGATRTAVGQNTNLGILLLCGPLAMAAERRMRPLQRAVIDVIASSDLADAEAVFEAIRVTSPGGLGTAARHDVRAPASVRLPAAMAEAASRDSIARQWANGFGDIFGPAIENYASARLRWSDPVWATLSVYVHFLTAFPDSHVQRKHGAAVAIDLQRQSHAIASDLQACPDPAAMLPRFVTLDGALKSRGLNPGTSADLTVATSFAWHLQNDLPFIGDDG